MPGERSGKPEIVYPCTWAYTVIGSKREAVNRAVGEVLQERPCKVVFSRISAGGSYCSFHVEVEVAGEEDRMDIFNRLSAHGCIKVVI